MATKLTDAQRTHLRVMALLLWQDDALKAQPMSEQTIFDTLVDYAESAADHIAEIAASEQDDNT
jgi:hypothetical protein